jgi:hypothetical protein
MDVLQRSDYTPHSSTAEAQALPVLAIASNSAAQPTALPAHQPTTPPSTPDYLH